MQYSFNVLLIVLMASVELEGCAPTVRERINEIKRTDRNTISPAGPRTVCQNYQCQQVCATEGLFYVSTQAECEYKGKRISCKQTLFPSTIARINCSYGYQKVRDYITCQSNGEWNYKPWLQCEEVCGKINIESVSAPWHVAIYKKTGGTFQQVCAGSIVNSKFVVTAFDCFEHVTELKQLAEYRIGIGKQYREYQAKESLAVQMIEVSNVMTNSIDKKTVVIVVAKDFIIYRPNVGPVCIDNHLQSQLKGMTSHSRFPAKTSGWAPNFQGYGSNVTIMSLPIMDQQSCIRVTGINRPGIVMCVGDPNGPDNILCDSDKGAGVVTSKMVSGNPTYYLFGTTTNSNQPTQDCGPYKAMFINHNEVEEIKQLVQDHRSYYELHKSNNPAYTYSSNEYCGSTLSQNGLVLSTCTYSGYAQPCDGPSLKGTQAQLTCKQGFRSSGQSSDTVTCESNGEWSSPRIRCEQVCNLPALPTNLRAYYTSSPSNEIASGQTLGETAAVTYLCNSGYYVNGAAAANCVRGTWNVVTPQCLKSCPPIYVSSTSTQIVCKLQNSVMPCTNPLPQGTVASIACQFGYGKPAVQSNDDVLCGSSGEWNDHVYQCEPVCILPPLSPNLQAFSMSNPTTAIPSGHVLDKSAAVIFRCGNGQSLNGDDRIFCDRGKWLSNVPTCVKHCDPLTFNPTTTMVNCKHNNAVTSCTSAVRPSTVATFQCQYGFERAATHPADRSTCDGNGEWTDYIPDCEPKCTLPTLATHLLAYDETSSRMLNGGHMFDGYASVIYSCEPNFFINGEEKNSCNKGIWASKAPNCIKYCHAISVNAVTTRVECKYNNLPTICTVPLRPTSIATIDCQFGAGTPGGVSSNVLLCGDNGEWSQNVFDCEQKCSLPALPANLKGYVNGIEVQVGHIFDGTASVTYKCANGYYLNGASENSCQNGVWLNNPSNCEKFCSAIIVNSTTTNVLCKLNTVETICSTPIRQKTIASMSCHKGYGKPDENANDELICGSNGEWSAQMYQCEPLCVLPDLPSNLEAFQVSSPSIEIGRDHVFGNTASITYKCDSGFSINGETTSQCDRGKWSTTVPTCMKYCPAVLPTSTTTKADCKYNNVATSCTDSVRSTTLLTIQCQTGYQRPATTTSNVLRCNDDGTWNAQPYQCEATCVLPTLPPNVKAFNIYDNPPTEIQSGYIFSGFSAITYSCDKDYFTADALFNTCQNGKWLNAAAPNCVKNCPPIILNSTSTNLQCTHLNSPTSCTSPLHPKTMSTMTCQSGYKLPSTLKNNAVQCEDNGTWNATLYDCEPLCILPTLPTNLKAFLLFANPKTEIWAGHIFKDLAAISYTCDANLYSKDPLFNSCTNGKWLRGTPKCVKNCPPININSITTKVDCNINSITPTSCTTSPLHPETVVTIACQPGYKIPAAYSHYTTTCEDSGEWTDDIYECEPKCILPVLPDHLKAYLQASPATEINSGHQFEDNPSITYKCEDGYHLIGDTEDTCENGQWFSSVPTCGKYCPAVILSSATTEISCTYANVQTSCAVPSPPTTALKLTCLSGFRKPFEHTRDIIYCDANGHWTDVIYRCESICGIIPPDANNLASLARLGNNQIVPWHVGIYALSVNVFRQICGGTIINRKVVLSAAHCFYQGVGTSLLDAGLFRVFTGKYYRDYVATENSPTQILNVSKIHVPDTYHGATGQFEGDLAILILADFIELQSNIMPVCIEKTLNTIPLSVGFVAGWGLGIIGNDELNEVSMTAIETESCKKLYGVALRSFITNDKFCADAHGNSKSVCAGDRGAGIVFPKDRGDARVYYLRGIASVGPNGEAGCNSEKCSVFIKIHSHIDLIRQHATAYEVN